MTGYSDEAAELVVWAQQKAAKQAAVEPSAYTITSDPFLEAECGWINTGLIWEGYSQRDIEEITGTIARYVAVALVVGGYLTGIPPTVVPGTPAQDCYCGLVRFCHLAADACPRNTSEARP